MRVTVAICTWNRAALLDQTLQGLKRLVIPAGVAWEVVIVDNNSDDDTAGVIDRHARELPIVSLFEPAPGVSGAKNRAIDRASGDLIQWTDDDVLVGEGWMATLVEAAARHPDATGFAGPIDPWFPTSPDPDLMAAFPQLARGFCGIDYCRAEGDLPVDEQVVGANMAFRRPAVAGLRFDPRLGTAPRRVGGPKRGALMALGAGEEDDYVRQIRARGGQIIWVPSMRVRHYVDPRRMTLDYLKAFYVELGRNSVRSGGVPEGSSYAGVPRWLVRRWAGAGISSIYHQLRGSRAAALEQVRFRSYYRGVIEEARAVSRAGMAGAR